MTRQVKTPKQRAEEALGVAERRHGKALRTVQVLTADLARANDELDEAKRLHAYAQQHPALQNPSSTTNQEASTPA